MSVQELKIDTDGLPTQWDREKLASWKEAILKGHGIGPAVAFQLIQEIGRLDAKISHLEALEFECPECGRGRR